VTEQELKQQILGIPLSCMSKGLFWVLEKRASKKAGRFYLEMKKNVFGDSTEKNVEVLPNTIQC
jgi:hypothetical protein